MVDKKHQQKSIGRVALGLALHEIKQIADMKEIEICYNPQNPVAKSFYGSFGFIEQGLEHPLVGWRHFSMASIRGRDAARG